MTNEIKILIDEIIKKNPLQKNFLRNAFDEIGSEELSGLTNYIEYCNKINLSIEFLADSYNLFAKDTVKEQMYFMRNKSYRYSSYNEVAENVYNNPDYMEKYMYGLAVTTFIWPQHRQMKKLFYDALNITGSGKYLEVGPGHGSYLLYAIKNTDFDSYKCVDISASSIKLTKDIVKYNLGEVNNFTIEHSDFLEIDEDKKYNLIILSEVIEHVENPSVFLDKAKRVLAENGKLFLSTCINSPAVDHIYLFQNSEEIVKLFEESNYKIIQDLIIPYPFSTLEESIIKNLPINVAYIIE